MYCLCPARRTCRCRGDDGQCFHLSIDRSAEEKEPAKKSNASYHISKRAKDNKWQVFRAGSDKVIKLFDTKVEAEEYTKRMAENQGVGYLSHASKGKNKGRIQKK